MEKLKIAVDSKSWKFPGGSAEVKSGLTTRWVLSQRHGVGSTSLALAAGAFQSSDAQIPHDIAVKSRHQRTRLVFSFVYPKRSFLFTNECNYSQTGSESNGNHSLAQWEEKWKIRSFLSYLVFLMTMKIASEISWMNPGTSFLAKIIISWLIIL